MNCLYHAVTESFTADLHAHAQCFFLAYYNPSLRAFYKRKKANPHLAFVQGGDLLFNEGLQILRIHMQISCFSNSTVSKIRLFGKWEGQNLKRKRNSAKVAI